MNEEQDGNETEYLFIRALVVDALSSLSYPLFIMCFPSYASILAMLIKEYINNLFSISATSLIAKGNPQYELQNR